MSAIWALAYHDGRPVDPADLARMSQALAPLGPERCGQWQDGQAGLGHRLMAFTPEDLHERQPLHSADGCRVLVFDGRIDNRPELVSALRLDPQEARHWPDSAFVLRAFEAWGEGCAAHLIGGLACIVWDKRARRLFAFSTPGNSCALYYCQTPHLLAMASLPRGLLALPFVSPQLDEARLARFLLRAKGGDRSATFFAGIRRLPAGHTLSAEAGQVQLQRYWSPDPKRQIHFARDDDYVEAFNELFERVVSDHLRSLSPVGVMMSGGLDSTSVAAVAASQLKARGQGLVSFTSVPDAGANADVHLPPRRFGDESPQVRSVAAWHDNLEAVFVSTGGLCFLDDLESRFVHHQSPPVAAANRVWLDGILGTARQRDVRVLLTGEAGNHTISWNGQGVTLAYLRQGRIGAAWREARGLAQSGQAHSPWHALISQGLIPLLPEPLWQAYVGWRKPAVHWPVSAVRPGFAHAHGLAPGQIWRTRTLRVDADPQRSRFRYATNKADTHMPGQRSQFGVDCRDPTGDQRVVEFCLAVPDEQCQRDGRARWLIRRAMAGRLPEDVLSNKQRGAQGSDWLHRLLGRQADAAQTVQQMQQDDLVRRALDLERLGRLVDAWPEPQPNDKRTIHDYFLLQDALVTGRFILWAHGLSGGERPWA